MKRHLLVFLLLSLIGGCAYRLNAAPVEVARITATPSGGLSQAYGEGFLPGKAQVRVLAINWPGNPGDNDKVWEAALKSATGKMGGGALPATPPAEAVNAHVVDATGQVVAFTTPFTGVSAVWVGNGDGTWSVPYLVNLPEPWWLDKDTVSPGAIVRVFGRKLCDMYKINTIVLQKQGKTIRAPLAEQHDPTYARNPYKIGLIVPQEATEGIYTVWVHNGSGGEYGWKSAGRINVVKSLPRTVVPVINARRYGAKGDGSTDDTAAIAKALAAAAPKKACLYFEPGIYPVSKTITVPPGVSIRGAGKANSIIISSADRPVSGGFPMELEKWDEQGGPNDWYPYVKHSTPIVWLRNASSISDMGIEQRGTDGVCVLVADPGKWCDDIRIANCAIRSNFTGSWIDRRYNPCFGGIWIPNKNRRLTITDNELYATTNALTVLSRTERAEIARNQIYSLSDQGGDLTGFRGGPVNCIFEDNRIYNSKRGFTFQQPQPSMYHNYFGRNTQEWIDRGGNANETLLMEGWKNVYIGGVTSAVAEGFTVASAAWKPNEHRERYALIISGRGLGQFGRIKENDAHTVKLEMPWRVVPDATTRLIIGDFFAENVFYNQNDRVSGAAFQFWGNCLDNTVDALHSYDTEGVIFWAENHTEYSASAPFCYYNEVINSRMTAMGRIEFRGSVHYDPRKRYTEAPVILGNIVRDTAVVDFKSMPNNQPGSYWKWYAFWMEPFAAVDFWNRAYGAPGDMHAARKPSLVTADMPYVFAYNVIDGCLFQRGARGGHIDPGAYRTLFHNNRLDEVKTPYEDLGKESVITDR